MTGLFVGWLRDLFDRFFGDEEVSQREKCVQRLVDIVERRVPRQRDETALT